MIDDDILVINLRGKLDSATTKEFEDVVQKHFDDGKSKIIIDCAHLGFISSLGIGSLVRMQARLNKRGGAVKLALSREWPPKSCGPSASTRCSTSTATRNSPGSRFISE